MKNRAHINDLRPFLRKNIWILPAVSTLIIIFSPILFPIAFIIGYWKEVKEGFVDYFKSAVSGYYITYDYYKEKNKNDRQKHDAT